MSTESRRRDLNLERLERDALILLLHVYGLSGGNPDVLLWSERLAEHLAFEPLDGRRIMDHLVLGDYLARRSTGGVSITDKGVAYIEGAAGRRRSVRLQRSIPPS